MMHHTEVIYNFPVKVHLAPTLDRYRDGTLVAGSGDTWVIVPEGTTFADIGKWVARDKPEQKPRIQTKQIAGSKGNVYTLTVYPDERMICSCPGFKYRGGNCKHVKAERKSRQ